jgi:hypothetical protein
VELVFIVTNGSKALTAVQVGQMLAQIVVRMILQIYLSELIFIDVLLAIIVTPQLLQSKL